MRMAIWTPVARPPDFPVAAWLDDNTCQVGIPDRVPLQLQCWIEEAEVGLLWLRLRLLLLSCGVAPPSALLQLRRTL